MKVKIVDEKRAVIGGVKDVRVASLENDKVTVSWKNPDTWTPENYAMQVNVDAVAMGDFGPVPLSERSHSSVTWNAKKGERYTVILSPQIFCVEKVVGPKTYVEIIF
ncbi:hypothetical protein A9K97_gp164 [Tokyovirus A1]|uniref:hypothetical protein n=1 Tax=Tokyovirus A1 TaxID=1826170 RepID=UPI0007A96D24|nr:hypothetical protein A9K97_gp164 [Tokyovirus A1]BAU80187.1 hypothetical protein [Tokyovirus A1]